MQQTRDQLNDQNHLESVSNLNKINKINLGFLPPTNLTKIDSKPILNRN